MTTPKTSQSIPLYPQTSYDPTMPEVAPYAIDGATAEPSLTRELNGWQAGVIPPADQENWFRAVQWAINARNTCVAAFTLRATTQVALGGALAAGNTIRITYDGNDNDYIVTPADVIAGFATVSQNWATQLTTDVTLRSTLDFSAGASAVLVSYRLPGNEFPTPVTCSVVSGTTTVTASDYVGGSSSIPLMVDTGPGNGTGLPLLHGGNINGATVKLHYYGNGKLGAFRAGSFSGTQANPANVGEGSAAFGVDNVASGEEAIALGLSNTASGDHSLAAGSDNTASNNDAVALGNNNTASAGSAVAIGDSNNVGSAASCAIGVSNVLNGTQVMALGSQNVPTGDYAVCIGTNNSAGANYSTALGKNANPDTYGEVAIGSGCFSANGDAQMGFTVFRRTAVDNVGMLVTTDGTGTGISIYMRSNNVYAVSMDVAAKWLSGSGGGAGAGDCAQWSLQFMASVDNAGTVTVTGITSTNIAPSNSVGQGSTYRLGYQVGTNTFTLRAWSGHNSNTIRVTGSSRHTNT